MSDPAAAALPLRALVLEDERHARSYLVELLEASQLAHVYAAVPTPELATEALAHAEAIDVAFVDVNLVGASGMETAGLAWIESVLRRGDAPRIVLTTASREHAVAAFELGATDFLLKPFVIARVKESLLRVQAALSVRAASARVQVRIGEGRVVARKGKRLVFLAPGEPWAFEAEGRLCFVHTGESRLDVDLSLSALEAVLGDRFVRVHRNWLVALEHVREMDRDSVETALVLGDGRRANLLRVPVARDRVATVRDRLVAATVGLRRDE